jgi:Uncharacterized protein conserved in archaea
MPRLVWTLPLKLRPKLARPLDKVYSAHEFEKLISRVNPRRLVTVGDIVTASVIQKGIVPKIGIIDGKTKRERTDINLPFNLKKQRLGTLLVRFRWMQFLPSAYSFLKKALTSFLSKAKKIFLQFLL